MSGNLTKLTVKFNHVNYFTHFENAPARISACISDLAHSIWRLQVVATLCRRSWRFDQRWKNLKTSIAILSTLKITGATVLAFARYAQRLFIVALPFQYCRRVCCANTAFPLICFRINYHFNFKPGFQQQQCSTILIIALRGRAGPLRKSFSVTRQPFVVHYCGDWVRPTYIALPS